MTARPLSTRIVAATLLTAMVSSLALAGSAAAVLAALRRQQDAHDVRALATGLTHAIGMERAEPHQHTEVEASVAALSEAAITYQRVEVWSGAELVAQRGHGPLLGTADHAVEGWAVERRRLLDALVLVVAVPRQERALAWRLFWVSLLVAAVPSILLAVVTGRRAARALARPVAELAERVSRLRDPGSSVVPEGETGRLLEVVSLERSFQEVLGRLARALEREAAFSRNAAHELRTPLTRMRLQAESAAAALASAGVAGAGALQLQALIGEVDRLTRLTDSLLALSQDPDRAVVRGETVNLADLLRASAAAGERRVSVEAPDEALVRGDEDLLRLAVDNLVDNARKYTPEGADPGATVVDRDGHVDLVVESPGARVDPGERELLFERFFRGAAAQGSAPGYGLGLALARNVARRHGGDVCLLEETAEGAAFRLRLPAWRPEA